MNITDQDIYFMRMALNEAQEAFYHDEVPVGAVVVIDGVVVAAARNSREATRVANQLLKIKQRRFGSIDRESNYLVEAVGGELAALQNEGLFLALVLQRCLITEVLEAVESESTVLLEELG